MAKFKQGYFTPRYPEKYVGDITKIRYMSSWELSCHKFFDGNPNVLRWSSESIPIKYIKPTDGKLHTYYPDYWVEYVSTQGEIIQEIIEVKPLKQTKKPTHGKHLLYEQLTYAINMAKWHACNEWCKKRGITFRIITERKIFN